MARKKSKSKRKPSGRKSLHSPVQTPVIPTPIVPIVQNHAIPQLFQQAIHYQNTGHLQQAISLYQQILQIDPNHVNTLTQFAIILHGLKQFDKSIAFFEKVVNLQPHSADAHNNLGNALRERGNFEKATVHIQQALKLNPNHARAYNNLGTILYEQNKLEESIKYFKKAIDLMPSYAKAYSNLGGAFQRQGKFNEAIGCYQRALALDKNSASTYKDLGTAFKKYGKLSESIGCYQNALTLNPNYIEVYNDLGLALVEQGNFQLAMQCYQRALAINPNFAEALNNIAILYKDKGNIDKTLEYQRKILNSNLNRNYYHSNFLYTFSYSIQYDRAAIFKEHQKFNEIQALPLAHLIKPYQNERNPNKRLKIGYISPDFRKHSVAYFIEPILSHHNHESFEIYCYYSHTQNDEVTQRLKQYADKWLNCYGLSDDELAEQIRQDKIDIMVDLMGHTGMNRILVFARKPAPIQMTYLGYSNTTGLTAIDYHLSDRYADPEGTEPFNSETIVRMSHSYFCYSPPDETRHILVEESPCISNKYITFGSFNVRAKLSPIILKLWSKLLKTFPNSKLFLKNRNYTDIVNQKNTAEKQKLLQEYFGDLEVDFEQVIIEGHSPSMQQHLEMYHKVDISLDSFPYNGATTTCEALWMGVPVVTLVGDTHVSRMGLSILSTLGLEELIAYTPEEYVAICVKLANNLNYLQQLRSEMRERMLSSPLMDGQSFTQELESHYKNMWHKWCQSNSF